MSDRAAAGTAGAGLLVVLTAPSGTGKSSVVKALLGLEPSLRFSVSHTTRPPRPGETEGVDYRFVSEPAFRARVEEGAFVEWATVHGHLYGTASEEIDRALGTGADVLLDIDVQGARQVADRFAGAVTIFLLPPDYATLEARLRGRKSDDAAAIASRLATASTEVRHYGAFQYLVVNDDLEGAASEIRSILGAERARTARRLGAAERILATFPAPKT
jgi:guanylate kinase